MSNREIDWKGWQDIVPESQLDFLPDPGEGVERKIDRIPGSNRAIVTETLSPDAAVKSYYNEHPEQRSQH